MSKAKGGGKAPIIVLIGVIILLLAGLAWYLERRASQPGQETTEEQRPVPDAALMIKGCLFDLGVHKDQVERYEQSFQVKTDTKFTRGRLSASFAPLERYGTVDVKNSRHVQIKIGARTWIIEFLYGKKETAAVIPPQPVTPTPAAKAGRMAIIVDDMGMEMKPAQQLAAIDGDLTFSILPLRPYSREVAQYLHAKGREVLLHLPMQGNGGKDPGEGAIYKDMTPTHIRTILGMDMRSVPYIVGSNNHMGSEVTPDKAIMLQVMRELRSRRLFFIDSLTASDSVGSEAARSVSLPHNARDIFLDNEPNDAYITGQLVKLKNVARKHSSAIGICHPHPETIAVLAREVPKLQAEGITLTRVSAFVHP